ncbi:MAG: tRNA (N6-threonylcarbamoyladenosine(37)-N6)-methyltransferase TrmO [Gammaproteobacteria bacterium 28-57-27]|nr:MAG: tRNA (N6-threonylcarbamoyladenosine(37)-N6)-methyltransferase TrmO [Gammaproteobacteria bacterium 28-57-27]
MSDIVLRAIGVVRTPFAQKFGIPRQGGLVDEVHATLELDAPYNREEAWRGIEGFSHLWLLTWFHAEKGAQAALTVRPPRLGGNARLGVFATRAPYRPNPVGLSLVRLVRVEKLENGAVRIHVAGVDLLDGTPLLDVKPYLPYVEALPSAVGGFAAEDSGAHLRVEWTAQGRAACAPWLVRYPNLCELVEALLQRDPRPAYQAQRADEVERVYGMLLYDLDVRWRVEDGVARVLDVVVKEV